MSSIARARWAAVVAGAALLGIGATAWWLIYGDDRRPTAPTDVIVPDGSSVREIAFLLQADGVISDARLFEIYARLRGGFSKIDAAQYRFRANETMAQVGEVLRAGGHAPFAWITVPEGFTAADIGRRLAAAGLVDQAAFVKAARGQEGYLFPDTYQVPRGTPAQGIVAMFEREFHAKLPPDAATQAARLRMTLPQIVTIASMIEREAKVDDERPLIASVIYNRIRIGMPLEIDATIEYALPHHKTALSYADLAVASPYNTYTHIGLPPTPICNPGSASIAAALHPASTSFLYYVYKGGGRHAFSRTLQQQQSNERRYLR